MVIFMVSEKTFLMKGFIRELFTSDFRIPILEFLIIYRIVITRKFRDRNSKIR